MQSLLFAGADVEFWPTLGGITYKLYAEKRNPSFTSQILKHPQ
jgi:hypothetical protein